LSSEDELIRLAQGGDVEAFCRLAKRYERRVYTLALHFCRDHHDAEDLSQEVWLKAFRSLTGFRFESGFYTWLRQITVNTFLNHRRTRSFSDGGERTALRFDSLDELDAEPTLPGAAGRSSAEDKLQAKILVSRVLHALGGLTPQQRLIFLLKHQEGMTYQEIAACFGCSAGSVKKSLFRTLARLRDSLGVRGQRRDVAALAATD
jgi:RNA polymerase sigma-70 factor, ECF subfamily